MSERRRFGDGALAACSKTSCSPREGTRPTIFPRVSACVVGPVPSPGSFFNRLLTARTRTQLLDAPAFSRASFDGNDLVMIENLIIFARRLFKNKHHLACRTEHEKILMVDLQLAPVGQLKNNGFPVSPNGFDILDSHARKRS